MSARTELTPAPKPGPPPSRRLTGWHAARETTHRQRRLLAAIDADPGEWRTGRVEELYKTWHVGYARTAAKADLRALAACGLLVRKGPDYRIRYRLASNGGRR